MLAYFAWVKGNLHKVPAKGKTHKGFSYCINQEKSLHVFWEDGEVPIDNNAAEQSIRGFCIGKKLRDDRYYRRSRVQCYYLWHCRNSKGKQS